jgi:DNA polymerase I
MIHEISHHACTKRKGFYSLLIGALKDLRIHWFLPLSKNYSFPEEDRNRAEAASKMLKLISVSAYGVTIRIHGLACPPLAESITGIGRWVLKTTWKIAEELGMQPTYGDTDSIFLDNPSLHQVQTLVKRVKNQLKLELAKEKHYTLCVLSKAKKAYFGISKDEIPDLKGLTAVKSNAPNFIQRVFRQCVQILSDVNNMKQYDAAKKKIAKAVQEAKKQLMEGKVDLQDLIYSVQLNHEPQERIRATGFMPQPYQCAMQQIDNGEKLGRRSIIHFLKVKPFKYKSRTFTVKPFSSVRNLSEINIVDYIRNLTSALEQTFEPMGINLDTEFNKKLTDWFSG